MITKRVYRQILPCFWFHDVRVSHIQLATLFEILGLLIKSGTSLTRSVSLLNDQSENTAQKEIIHAWYKEILNGKSLADTIRDTGTPVSDKRVLEIASSERAGQLGSVLLNLSKAVKRDEKIKIGLTFMALFGLVLAVASTMSVI